MRFDAHQARSRRHGTATATAPTPRCRRRRVDRTRRDRAESGRPAGLFAIAAGGSLYAWDVALQYGAHHAFLYHRRQQLLVLSLVALFGRLIMRGRARFGWWLLIVFAPPILVFFLQLAESIKHVGPVAEDLSNVTAIGYVVTAPCRGDCR